MNPRAEYANRLAARRASLATLDRRHQTVGYARVLVALCGIAIAGTLVIGRASFSAWWLLAPLPFLFLLGGWLERLEASSATLSRAIQFYERGVARIDGHWPGTGTPGTRFLDEHHVYARDLDLFGCGSLFDLICNARTTTGEETLARWLLNPSVPEDVRQRQDAVKDVGPRVDFHEQMAIVDGQVRSGVNPTSLTAWGARPLELQSRLLRPAAWGGSIAGALVLVAIMAYLTALAGVVALPDTTLLALRVYFLPVGVLVSAVVWRFKARTDRILGEAESATTYLALLERLLLVAEAETFASPRLVRLRTALQTDGQQASRRIAALNRLMNIADIRRNWFIRLTGPLVLFDLHMACRLEDWRAVSGPSVARWLATIGEIEAIASLASYHYGRPGHVFPDLVDGPGRFEADAIGHPLLDPSVMRVVTNDVSIIPPLQILIVSGSNMSGKSTFLRTLGINVVLAQAGGPVYATRMRLSPLAVGASIHIQDSLREGVSRFYAEILRLKQIMDAARDRAPLLFLIDEFLHGTNSHDRLLGATAIVRGLVDRGAIGLITTHDLALTAIAGPLGPNAGNVHFQDDVREGRLHYDYVMRPGIVSRSNAIELMRSVGLDV